MFGTVFNVPPLPRHQTESSAPFSLRLSSEYPPLFGDEKREMSRRGQPREEDSRMSRLKAKEEAVKFQRGEDVLFRKETEMGREVSRVGVKIEPRSTSEILAVKKKNKQKKTWMQGQMGWTLKCMLYIKSCISSVFEAKQRLSGDWWMCCATNCKIRPLNFIVLNNTLCFQSDLSWCRGRPKEEATISKEHFTIFFFWTTFGD